MPKRPTLKIIESCNNCGVCCFHMGYPAFMLPRTPKTKDEIRNDKECQKLLDAGWTMEELEQGHPGESFWHTLPIDLKNEWQAFVSNYQKSGQLDGRCFWLDDETNLCKHHQHRPQVCRDFEVGCSDCHDWRRYYQID